MNYESSIETMRDRARDALTLIRTAAKLLSIANAEHFLNPCTHDVNKLVREVTEVAQHIEDKIDWNWQVMKADTEKETEWEKQWLGCTV